MLNQFRRPRSGSHYAVDTVAGDTKSSSSANSSNVPPVTPRTHSMRKMKVENPHKLSWERLENAKDELRVMTEEAAEWVAQTLGLEHPYESNEDFFNRLQTGVDLCLLAEKVAPPSHPITVKCNKGAKPGSWPARDNISNFISAAKQLGVHGISIFETDDVLLRKNDKAVINSLLQLARLAAKNGVKPPLIVQYEMEIDAFMAAKDSKQEEEEDDEEPEPHPRGSQGLPYKYLPYIPSADDLLDEAIARTVNLHKLDIKIVRNKKTGHRGEYRFGKPPSVFVRLIRNVLLVRVGGGWENLISFIRRKLGSEGGDGEEMSLHPGRIGGSFSATETLTETGRLSISDPDTNKIANVAVSGSVATISVS